MPTIRDMVDGHVYDYPKTGCKMCDGLRKAMRRPDVFCLSHDPDIPEDERKRLHIKFEAAMKVTPRKKENEHA